MNKIKILIVILLPFIFNTSYGQELTLMSYNMRLDLDIFKDNTWESRKVQFINQLKTTSPDIIGTQEGRPNQIKYIDDQLPQYDYIGLPRDGKNGIEEYCAIYYNKNKFELLKSNTFWLSNQPSKVSKGWDAAFLRVCTYGLFKDKIRGTIFWVFNTHLDNQGELARIEGLILINKKIAGLNIDNHTVILMGDFNAKKEQDPIKYISTYFNDTKLLSKNKSDISKSTFNGFSCDHLEKMPIIDYIFISKSDKIIINNYKVLDDFVNCVIPSDHFAILTTLTITND